MMTTKIAHRVAVRYAQHLHVAGSVTQVARVLLPAVEAHFAGDARRIAIQIAGQKSQNIFWGDVLEAAAFLDAQPRVTNFDSGYTDIYSSDRGPNMTSSSFEWKYPSVIEESVRWTISKHDLAESLWWALKGTNLANREDVEAFVDSPEGLEALGKLYLLTWKGWLPMGYEHRLDNELNEFLNKAIEADTADVGGQFKVYEVEGSFHPRATAQGLSIDGRFKVTLSVDDDDWEVDPTTDWEPSFDDDEVRSRYR